MSVELVAQPICHVCFSVTIKYVKTKNETMARSGETLL